MGCIIIEIATLIVYGWESGKITEFRNKRRKNLKKGRPKLAYRHNPDDSFHNNWTVVEDWIHQLQIDDGSQKLKPTLNVAVQMMSQTPDSHLYIWEAELDLYNLQHPDNDRATRLDEGARCVQPPPPPGKVLNGTQTRLQPKILNGTGTPLHRAAQNGNLERLIQLFEFGWSLSVQDHKGQTALDVFEESKPSYLYAALREGLAPKTLEKVTDDNQGWKLLQAAISGQVELVQDLLAQGVDIMLVDNEGCSVLHKAVGYGQSRVAECLLQAEGKKLLRQKNFSWGDTPLHKTASMGSAAIMKQLLACSPDIEDQQKDGQTALYVAAQWGREEAVEVLLDHGAQTFTQRDHGDTPLHAAAISGHIKILKRLLKAPDGGKCLEHKN